MLEKCRVTPGKKCLGQAPPATFAQHALSIQAMGCLKTAPATLPILESDRLLILAKQNHRLQQTHGGPCPPCEGDDDGLSFWPQ
jgi:hypothetical protein